MLRIAHVTATFHPYYAGTGIVCAHNARLMAERGHHVTVFTAQIADEPDNYMDGYLVRRLPSIFRIGNAPLSPALLRMAKYDIIHLHYPYIFGADLIWMNHCISRQPYIVTYHNDLVGHGFKGALFYIYQSLNTRLILRSARKIIAVTMDHARNSPVLQRYTQKAGKVVEVHNGIDADRFHPWLDGEPFRRSLGLTDSNILMVFVGTMDRAHHDKLGVPQLLHAFAGLETKQAFLALVGGGDMLPVYQAQAQELGLNSRVAFTGLIPNEQIGSIYAGANFTVQPSLFEPFGLTIAEAMACGKPVITTNVPGVRSIVHDGEDGLLVEPGDIDDLRAKMQLLIDSPQQCKEMGAKGRQKIEGQYAWPMIASQLEQVYRNALQ